MFWVEPSTALQSNNLVDHYALGIKWSELTLGKDGHWETIFKNNLIRRDHALHDEKNSGDCKKGW